MKAWAVEALMDGDPTRISPERGAAILADLAQHNFEDAQLIPGPGRLGVTGLMAGTDESFVKQAATAALESVLPEFGVISVTATATP